MQRNSKQERERERAGDAKMFRAWKAFHHEQLAEALTGLHRDVIARLMAHLKKLRSARELVEFIDAQDWSAVDASTRLVALHEINAAIIKLRESQRLPPIDDPLWHEPLNAFLRIRETMNQFPAHVGRPVGVSGKHREGSES
jgi:hypothetical protein